MKVLVTIGSMVEKKFTRLFNIIEEICEEGILDGNDVTTQVGFDEYKSEIFKVFDMIPDEEFKNIIEQSDLIITHAGTGTVTACLKKGKKVIIFPRVAAYDEHYDNHQLELSELFTKNNYTMCAKNKEQLISCIEQMETFVPQKFISNNTKMNELIIDYIECN